MTFKTSLLEGRAGPMGKGGSRENQAEASLCSGQEFVVGVEGEVRRG